MENDAISADSVRAMLDSQRSHTGDTGKLEQRVKQKRLIIIEDQTVADRKRRYVEPVPWRKRKPASE